MGYARGRCPRFLDMAAPDASRFIVARDEHPLIRIQYVVERDHHPHAHGALEYTRIGGALAGATVDALLATQALAYVASYLRRRPAAV